MRIISIDGGGVYGVSSAVLLKRLIEKYPTLLEKVDMIAGTSIGGVIAMGLAKGISPEEIINYFRSFAEDAFVVESLERKCLSPIGLKSFYSNKGLLKIMDSIFGDTKLKDMKKNVLVPAFDLHNEEDEENPSWKAKVFHNFPSKRNDNEKLAKEIAVATAAVPVMFPSFQGYIDGAFVANNPTMMAIAQTQDERNFNPPVPLTELKVLSLGKHTSGSFVKGDSNDWGYLKWILPLIDIALNKDALVIDFESKQFLRERYHRLIVCLHKDINIAIDDFDKIDQLIEIAEETDISETLDWLNTTY